MPYPEVNSHANAVRVGAAMPDLPAFQVVKPNQHLKVEDFRLPDGSPMVGPNGYLVPPAREFSMVVNAATRVYSYRFDEAMRDNWVNARAMRRDAFIRGLLEERILPTINRRWQLDVDDDRDPDQVAVRDGLTKVVEAIPDFDVFKRALLDGVWYGRAGCQWNYFRDPEVDDLWGVKKWDPVHGDSIQFTYDGVPAILMDAMTAGWYSANGATQGQWGDIRSTDRGGMALVLQKPTWRDRFAIHQHIREKADYFEGELAGSVQGLGLRGLVYWHYLIRTDALTWMLAYMQSVGQMDMLIFNYPWGNDAARNQQQANANKIIGKAAFIVPRNPQGNWQAVEQLSMNDSGLKALHDLISEYFDRHIERLIVGQSMSAGADNDSGLGGSGRANFAKATKDEILVYDTNRLDEVLTRDLIKPLKKYNFKWARFPVRFKSVLPNLEADKKVAAGKTMVELKIPIKVDELREAAGFSRPEEGDEVVQPPPDQNAMGMPGGPPGAPLGPGGAPSPSPVPGQPQPSPQTPPQTGQGVQPPVDRILTAGQVQPNVPVNPTSQKGFGRQIGQSLPTLNARRPVSYVKDAHGHEHKGSGPGGGQFTSGGQGESSFKDKTASSDSSSSSSKETGLAEDLRNELPVNEYGTPSGTKELPPTTLKGYRVGATEDKFGRGLFFSGDRAGAEAYANLHPGYEVQEYAISLKKPLLVGHQNDLCKALFNKTYSQMYSGGVEAGRKADVKIAKELVKRGYDGIVYLRPAPPAKTEIALLKGKSGGTFSKYDAAPAPVSGPYFPGGSNTYLPKFDETEIGFTRLSKGQDPTRYAERREGEVWQGPSGGWFTIKGGHVQPTPAPSSGGSSAPSQPTQSPQTQPSSRELTKSLSTTDQTGPDSQSLTAESRRQDHGLTVQPQPFVADPSKLRDPRSAQKEFIKTIQAQYPISVPLFHEAPIAALDSIVKNGLTSSDSAENVNFATVGQPSGFVTSGDKLIVKFGVRTRPQEMAKLFPDQRYDPANPAADLLNEHGGGALGADVAYADRVLPSEIDSIYVVRGGRVVDEIKPWQVRRPVKNERGEDPTQYGDHKFGCVMVSLQGQAAIEMLSRANLVRDCDLADDGREEEPHVTVRFGFHGGVTMGDVEEALRGKGPFELTLGKVSCFYGAETGNDYDVIKVDVTSPQIKAMHSILGRLPNTATHSEFKPHATIAYVKAGKGREYVKLLAPLDLTVTVDELEYSDASRAKSFFRLHGLRPRSESVRYSTDAHGHEHKESGPGGGQFTSKGGTSGGDNAVPPPTSSSSEHGGSAPSFAEEIKTWDDDKIWHEHKGPGPGGGQFTGVASSARQELNQDSFKTDGADSTSRLLEHAAKQLAQVWQVSPEDLAELAREDRATYATKEDAAWSFLKGWAGSSGGPIQTAAATAVCDELGLPYKFHSESQARVNEYIRKRPALSRATASFGKAMYETTQKWLANRGITQVKLVRSGANPDETGQAAASWSTDLAGVRDASRGVIEETVPAWRILSVPTTGFGTLAESEVVVLPKPRSQSSAPLIQDQYGRPLAPTLYAHAPKGGVTIKGKRFEGGEFIPSEVIDQATLEKRAAIEDGEETQTPSVSPETASVLRRVPPAAYQRLASRVVKMEEVPTLEAATEAWYAGEPSPPPRDRWTLCYGFYDPTDGRLVIGPGAAGVDRAGVLAHEIGHALDQSDDRREFQLSGDPEFVQAWRAEMGRGQLSNYARTDEVEGFAEACRLLYGTEGGAETFRTQFPRCYGYFRRVGLVS